MKKTRLTLKQAVRRIIVLRKYAIALHKVPELRYQANDIAISMLKLARQHGLDYLLVTGKF